MVTGRGVARSGEEWRGHARSQARGEIGALTLNPHPHSRPHPHPHLVVEAGDEIGAEADALNHHLIHCDIADHAGLRGNDIEAVVDCAQQLVKRVAASDDASADLLDDLRLHVLHKVLGRCATEKGVRRDQRVQRALRRAASEGVAMRAPIWRQSELVRADMHATRAHAARSSVSHARGGTRTCHALHEVNPLQLFDEGPEDRRIPCIEAAEGREGNEDSRHVEAQHLERVELLHPLVRKVAKRLFPPRGSHRRRLRAGGRVGAGCGREEV